MRHLIIPFLVLGLTVVAQADEGPKLVADGLDAVANELYLEQQQDKERQEALQKAVRQPSKQLKEPKMPIHTVTASPQSHPLTPKTHVYFHPARGGWGGWGHGGGGYGHRGGWGGDYHHASTAAEGWLSGMGRLRRGQARFLEGLGRYQNMHQEARTKAIENWQYGVETWWYLKDRYRERTYGKDWIDKETHRLNQAERRWALEQRRKDLIARGVLPQPKTPSITIRGYKYKNVAEWKGTADHVLHQLELQERDIRNGLRKLHNQVSFRRVVEWQRMSDSERQRYRTRKKAAYVLGQPTPDILAQQGREMAEIALEAALRRVQVKKKSVIEFIEVKGNLVIAPMETN